MPDNTPNWDLPPERFMTDEEIGKTLLKAHELFDLGVARRRKPLVRDAMVIFTALYTGLRRAEICDLMVRNLHLGNGRSHMVVKGKGGKVRTVHVGKVFKKILKAYLAWKAENGELHPDAYLIRSSKSEKYTPTALWKRWRKYAPNGHRLHDCRHSVASNLLRSGAPVKVISETLGHRRLSTTMIYTHASPAALQSSMCALESLAKDAMKLVSKGSSTTSS
jgi:integrase